MRPHRIQLYRDPKGRWRYRRLAGNHRIVQASEQGFRHRWYARRRAISTVPRGVGYVVEVVDG